MGVYDLILEEDHDEVRRKISEAEAKSLTRTTRLGKDVLSKCVYVCTFMCNRHTSVCMYVCIPDLRNIQVYMTLYSKCAD